LLDVLAMKPRELRTGLNGEMFQNFRPKRHTFLSVDCARCRSQAPATRRSCADVQRTLCAVCSGSCSQGTKPRSNPSSHSSARSDAKEHDDLKRRSTVMQHRRTPDHSHTYNGGISHG
jgi:hypothetical protein